MEEIHSGECHGHPSLMLDAGHIQEAAFREEDNCWFLRKMTKDYGLLLSEMGQKFYAFQEKYQNILYHERESRDSHRRVKFTKEMKTAIMMLINYCQEKSTNLRITSDKVIGNEHAKLKEMSGQFEKEYQDIIEEHMTSLNNHNELVDKTKEAKEQYRKGIADYEDVLIKLEETFKLYSLGLTKQGPETRKQIMDLGALEIKTESKILKARDIFTWSKKAEQNNLEIFLKEEQCRLRRLHELKTIHTRTKLEQVDLLAQHLEEMSSRDSFKYVDKIIELVDECKEQPLPSNWRHTLTTTPVLGYLGEADLHLRFDRITRDSQKPLHEAIKKWVREPTSARKLQVHVKSEAKPHRHIGDGFVKPLGSGQRALMYSGEDDSSDEEACRSLSCHDYHDRGDTLSSSQQQKKKRGILRRTRKSLSIAFIKARKAMGN